MITKRDVVTPPRTTQSNDEPRKRRLCKSPQDIQCLSETYYYLELACVYRGRHTYDISAGIYDLQLRLHFTDRQYAVNLRLFRIRSSVSHVDHRGHLYSAEYAKSPDNRHLRLHLSGPLVADLLDNPHLLRIR